MRFMKNGYILEEPQIIEPFFSKMGSAMQSQSVVGGIRSSFWYLFEHLDIERLSFQQDGATSHRARKTMITLEDNFHERLILRRSRINWSEKYWNLTPCDFFSWGYLKSKTIWHRKVNTLFPQFWYVGINTSTHLFQCILWHNGTGDRALMKKQKKHGNSETALKSFSLNTSRYFSFQTDDCVNLDQ